MKEYSIIKGTVVLNDCSTLVEWFDNAEDAENYIVDELDADFSTYIICDGYIIIDECSDFVDWFDDYDEAEGYVTDVLLNGNYVGMLW